MSAQKSLAVNCKAPFYQVKKASMGRKRINTGIGGLDHVLHGGLIPNRAYLLEGGPGTGKSTLGFHYLAEGVRQDESVLFITLGENRESIIKNAAGMGMDLSEVNFLDLTPREEFYKEEESYSVFSSSEMEKGPFVKSIVEAMDKYRPGRVFLDSITMLRHLTQDPLQLRKQTLSFINFVCSRDATLLMTTEFTNAPEQSSEQEPSFWVDGIIKLEYRPDWRRMRVTKFRGSDFIDGSHAYKINEEGMTVFPRLQPSNYQRGFISDPLPFGIPELDQMTSGGIEKGTTTLVTGPSGVGKTNLGIQFIKEAAERGERSAVYTFEESREIIVKRSESINVPIKNMLDSGNLQIMSVEPLSYSPDEFASIVQHDVEENGTTMVMIDSIGGYTMAVREENILERLHALTVYLQNMGVTTFLVNETQSLTGSFETTNMNASYLADNILFLRYLEHRGEIRKAIGVLKKRLSSFDHAIRDFKITSDGIVIGKPLTNLRGILSGMPELVATMDNDA